MNKQEVESVMSYPDLMIIGILCFTFFISSIRDTAHQNGIINNGDILFQHRRELNKLEDRIKLLEENTNPDLSRESSNR